MLNTIVISDQRFFFHSVPQYSADAQFPHGPSLHISVSKTDIRFEFLAPDHTLMKFSAKAGAYDGLLVRPISEGRTCKQADNLCLQESSLRKREQAHAHTNVFSI
jgi:hypothetical protein